MKDGFARSKPAPAPEMKPASIELPTPLKMPPPEGKPWWTVVLVIGLLGLVGAMVGISFASGARSFTGVGSFFPILMVGGLVAMLFTGRGGSQEMSRTKLDALRARFLLVIDELRGSAADAADRLDANYRWYHPAPATLETDLGSPRMWERKADGSDAWFGVVRVGVGMTDLMEAGAARFAEPQDMPTDIELEPVTGTVLQEFVRHQTVAYGLPALVSLLVEPGYELRGPRELALGLMRAIICQLAFSHGSDHIRLVVVTSDAAEWDWVKWLPHAGDLTVEDGAGPARMVYASVADFLAAQQDTLGLRSRGDFLPRHGAKREPIAPLPHTVVVCDTEAGWERLGDRAGISGLTFFDVRGSGQVPACAEPKRILHIAADGVITAVPRDLMSWDAKEAHSPQFFAVCDQVSREDAECFAEGMARWRLAEAYEALDDGGSEQFMARDILSYYGISDAANIDFAALWGPRSDINLPARLRVPLGNRADDRELFFLDLKESAQGGHGPHGVMAGTTGSGKTEMLRTALVSLLLGHPPQNLQLMLADLKGGAGVKPFAGVPHVAHIITDLEDDQSLLDRFVDAMWGEIARRKALCDRAGADDATEYNKMRSARQAAGQEPLPPLPALLVIIDEFAELFKMMASTVQDALDQICRQGRSYWVHLLIASQEIDNRAEKLLANMGYRLALKAQTQAAATAVGVPNAVNLKRSGDCYFLHGPPSNADVTKFRGEWLWREYRKPGVEDLDDDSSAGPGSVAYFAPQLFTTELTPIPSADSGADESATEGGSAAAALEVAGEGDVAAAGSAALMRPKVARIIIDQLRQVDFTPYRLWQPPLDEPWSVEKLVNRHLGRDWRDGYVRTPDLVFPIGVVDRPFKHDQHPLLLDVSGPGANVVIVGAQGSGKTTALQDLICAAAMTHTPEQVQFYCLAFSSAALSSVEGLPHVGGVALGAVDRDGVRRTVFELVALLKQRQRSFDDHRVMSLEMFRNIKFGEAPGIVPDDGYGDVFLVIDNWSGLASEYEVLLDPVGKLIKDGPTFGIHVVASVSRTSELPPTVRTSFGSRVELRLGETVDALLVKPRLADQVPLERPGRGMIAQNYERRGAEPVGLHTLMARPTTEAGVGDGWDSRSVVAAVVEQAAPFAPAKRVRRLPQRVSPEQLVAMAAVEPTANSPVVWALSETEQPVFFDSQHLLVTGQSKCGRTSVCAVMMSELARTYAPGGHDQTPAPIDARPVAQVWLIDPRRQLHTVLDSSYLYRVASTPSTIKQRMHELAAVLAEREPDDTTLAGSIGQLSWTGPEIWLVIDDAQRLPAGFDSPLEPIARFVEAGADVGLRIIYTRAFGGLMSSMGADPVLRRLRESRAALLVMDSDPDDGFIQGRWKGHPMPPGRGYLLNTAESGESGIYVQVADPGLVV